MSSYNNALHKIAANVYYRNGLCFSAVEDPMRDFLTLSDSFNIPGLYIFCSFGHETPSAAFIQNIRIWQKDNPRAALMWLSNPNQNPEKWVSHIIEVDINAPRGTLGVTNALLFGRYSLVLDETLTWSCTEKYFIFYPPDHNNHYNFNTDSYTLKQIDKKPIMLSADGSDAGCFYLSLRTEECGENMFSLLNAGIRFYNKSTKGCAASQVLYFDGAAAFNIALHPLCMTDKDKTYFRFPALSMPSLFSNVSGGAITLSCESGSAGLVFEKELSGDIYLGFDGKFQINGAVPQFMCGFSGTEYFKTNENSFLIFKPGQNAAIDKNNLTDEATTAWVMLAGSGVEYYKQPETAPVFCAENQKLLRLMNFPVKSYAEKTDIIPLMPYKDAAFTRYDDVLAIEECLKNKRFPASYDVTRADGSMAGRISSVAESIGITPQGLAMCVNGNDLSWLAVAGGGRGEAAVRISPNTEDATHMLQKMFQQTYVFHVFSSATDFSKIAYFSADKNLLIDGWKFILSPESWRSDSMMILKYTNRFSIADELKYNAVFKKCIERAKTSKNPTLYQSFLSIVEDKNFEGVVFLNCPVNFDELPAIFNLILRNIDKSLIYAHHVVIHQNAFTTSPGFKMEKPDIDAVVEYEKQQNTYISGNEDTYSFETKQLKLAVKSSVITDFATVSELTINRFWGSAITGLNNPSGNSLVIDGSVYYKDSVAEYRFNLRNKVSYGFTKSAVDHVNISNVYLTTNQNTAVFALDGDIHFIEMSPVDFLCYREGSGTGLFFQSVKIISENEGAFYDYYDDMRFLAADSIPATGSFADRFAAKPAALFTSQKNSPDDEGYRTITAPLRQSKIKAPWTGFMYDINAGSLGGLSDGALIVIKLLIAWCVEEDKLSYYAGVKLPPAMGGAGFDFQGFLKLGFKSVSLEETGSDGNGFELRLNNFVLQLLGLSFPKGKPSVTLFSDGNNIGWHGAYLDESKKYQDGEGNG